MLTNEKDSWLSCLFLTTGWKASPCDSGLRWAMTTGLFLTLEEWDLSENRFKWQESKSKFFAMKPLKSFCGASLMFKRPHAMPFNRHSPAIFFSFIVRKLIYHIFSFQLCKHFFFFAAGPKKHLALEWHKESWACFTVAKLEEVQVTKHSVPLTRDKDCHSVNFTIRVMCCQITWQNCINHKLKK